MTGPRSSRRAIRQSGLILAGGLFGALATVLALRPQLNRHLTVPIIVRDVTALWRGAAVTVADPTAVQYWGDSLTAGTGASPGHDVPALIAYLFHRPALNGGLPGATSAQIAARMLARPVPAAPETVVIWAGRNDDIGDPAATLRNIAAMTDSLPAGSRLLVLGLLNADTRRERRGGDHYAQILDLNRQLQARYGRRFLPLRELLIARAVPIDDEDRAAVAADVVPPSLRSDALHLNDRGDALAAYAIEATLETAEDGTDR